MTNKENGLVSTITGEEDGRREEEKRERGGEKEGEGGREKGVSR